MTPKAKAAQQVGLRAADELRRGAEALPLVSYYTPVFRKVQIRPPAHLTPDEAALWVEAEAVKETDREKYWVLRRQLLLSQSQRYQAAR